MPSPPRIDCPRLPSGYRGKGKPVIAEQYENMLVACKAVRLSDWEHWQRFLTALWLSGLCLSEAVALSWEKEAGFRIDVSGRHPVYKIDGGSQKNRKTQTCPLTPDFAAWLLAEIPEGQRRGRVLKLAGLTTGQQVIPDTVGLVVQAIAKKAGVRVTCHDYRRAFGTRWAKRVMPPVLMKLMRHASINTTMRYYVDLDAQDTADDLYRQFPAESNIPVTPDAAPQENAGKTGSACGNR